VEGFTYAIIFSIILSLMSGHAFMVNPEFNTQTEFVNYQVTLLPQELQLVGRGNLQLTYKAYVSDYKYFSDNSISNNLLRFYNDYAYVLYGLHARNVDDVINRLSSTNFPIYPVYAFAIEGTVDVKQDMKIVKLFYVVIDGNKYLVIPYPTSKYIFLPIIYDKNNIFQTSMITENGIEPVNSTLAIQGVNFVLSDYQITNSINELSINIDGTYTQRGISSVDITNPNTYYVIVTLFNYQGGLNQYYTLYVPPGETKHVHLLFKPTHAIVWRGFTPVIHRVILSYVPFQYMVSDKSEYYEGEIVRVMLTKGKISDYTIQVVDSTGKKIPIYYQSLNSKTFQFQAPEVDAFSEDTVAITLISKTTGLKIETMYITVKSKIYVENVGVDLEKGEASITLSQPLNSRKYSVDVTTKVCPVMGEKCGVTETKLSAFDISKPTITVPLDVKVIQIGYHRISITLTLTKPDGKEISFTKTIYKYISPSLFINNIDLHYGRLSGSDKYLYQGGKVTLKINVNNDLLSKKKPINIKVFVNDKLFKDTDIHDDAEFEIPIPHDYDYLMVTVYANNIEVFRKFYLVKPKPISVLLLENSWMFILAFGLVLYVYWRQQQKHPEMRMLKKMDATRARKQIEEVLRRRVIERIGVDAENVLFIQDDSDNVYITAWVSQYTRRGYLLITDLLLNPILETDLDLQALYQMMIRIQQGESPYHVAVDTFNKTKAQEIAELSKEAGEELVKGSADNIQGIDSLDIGLPGGTPALSNSSGSPEKSDGGLIDKLDDLFSDNISGDSSELIETSGGNINLDDLGFEESDNDNKKKGSDDFDLDLDLDFNLDI